MYQTFYKKLIIHIIWLNQDYLLLTAKAEVFGKDLQSRLNLKKKINFYLQFKLIKANK